MLAVVLSVVLLLAVGGGAFVFLTQDDEPTPANLGAAVTSYLQATPDFGQAAYCLKDFDYGKNPVMVSGFDAHTRSWLDRLVKAGLYSPGEAVRSGGFFAATNYAYTKTELGEKETQDGRLCLATGLKLERTGDIVRETGNSPGTVVAQAELSLAGIKPWADENIRGRFATRKGVLPVMFRFVVRDRHWVVKDAGDEVGAIQGAATKGAQATRVSDSVGIGAFFDKLFSFGASNPLLGKWQGEGLLLLEFRESNALVMGLPTSVRYEFRGKDVRVYLENLQREPLVVTVVDADTLSIVDGKRTVVVKRIR